MKKILVFLPVFGVPWMILSNRILAEIAAEVATDLNNAVVFTQTGLELPKKVKTIQCPGEFEGHWANTMQMCDAVIRYCMQIGITDVILVAATPHVRRCIRDLNIAMSSSGVKLSVSVAPQMRLYPSVVWFRPQSAQLRTRFWWSWAIWNGLINVLPEKLYVWLTTHKPL